MKPLRSLRRFAPAPFTQGSLIAFPAKGALYEHPGRSRSCRDVLSLFIFLRRVQKFHDIIDPEASSVFEDHLPSVTVKLRQPPADHFYPAAFLLLIRDEQPKLYRRLFWEFRRQQRKDPVHYRLLSDSCL